MKTHQFWEMGFKQT